MEECKRCLLRESAGQEIFDSIQEHLTHFPPHQKADQALYRKRLTVCRECDHLLAGTCMKCGCYVELRAALSGQKCPYKKW